MKKKTKKKPHCRNWLEH